MGADIALGWHTDEISFVSVTVTASRRPSEK